MLRITGAEIIRLIKAKTMSKANGNCAIASASPVDALVKDLSDLRTDRLNPFETISLAKHSPRRRQALESFCQAIQKQRYQNFLSKKLSKLIGKQSPRCRGKHFASPQQA